MLQNSFMVGVAQLAEHRVVAPAVAGSSPVVHPSKFKGLGQWPNPSFFISNTIPNHPILKFRNSGVEMVRRGGVVASNSVADNLPTS